MNGPRWASLGGWTSDSDRPGFLANPGYPGFARTPDGAWWSQADIDRARVVVDEAGRVLRLELAREEIAAQGVGRPRLEVTPADRAANEEANEARERFRARLRERASGQP